MLDEHSGPASPSTVSVGNDLKLEVAALARLLCGLVLYASIYICCCGWRSAWPSCAAARTPSATLRFSPSPPSRSSASAGQEAGPACGLGPCASRARM